MARGSAQNAKGNKANNQPASAKGAGSHLRANKGHETDFDDFEPLVEPSANRDIAGVVIAVLAIASFIAVISPATAPVTAAVAGFYHLGFGLGAYVLPIVILLFAATLFLGEDSPLNVRSVAGGAVVFIAVVSILSLMVPGTSVSCDLMFTPQNLSASGGYIGAFIASALQNALGKPIAMVVLLGLVVVGLVIIGFSVGGVLRSARDRAADFAERRRHAARPLCRACQAKAGGIGRARRLCRAMCEEYRTKRLPLSGGGLFVVFICFGRRIPTKGRRTARRPQSTRLSGSVGAVCPPGGIRIFPARAQRPHCPPVLLHRCG